MLYIHGRGVIIPFAKKYKSFLIVAAAAILVLSQMTFLLGRTGATSNWPTTNPNKISICHAASAVTNPYQAITVDKSSADGIAGNSGQQPDHYSHNDPVFNSSMQQGDEWGDIIPPIAGVHSGLNWSVEGQAIWTNQCSLPEEDEVLGEQCSVTAVSDITNKVVEYGNANAVALSFIHSAWTADVPEATWIWSDNPVADPTNQTVRTFTKTFGWSGPVDTAVIKIAADNDYELWVNDISVGIGSNTFAGANQHDIEPAIQDGNNTIKLKVTNWAWPTSDPQVNPAGLKFQAVVTSTQEEGCNPPVEEVPDEPEVPASTLVANKIICEDEASLPNWGPGGPDITSATFATDWVAQHPGCELVDEWNYQYRLSGDATEPTGYGELAGWTTFTNDTEVTLSGSTTIQVREVLPEGYIPFTGWTSQDNVSAEFYCHDDVLNYDNWEWIQNPQDGATYYCVAWNVLQTIGQIEGLVYNDIDQSGARGAGEPALEDWDVYLLTHNSPYTVLDIDATDGSGEFLFDGLPFGTYYVCQDLQTGWLQTQLGPNDASVGAGLTIGTILPDTAEMHDLITDYCYQVVLSPENPESTTSVFGNFQTRGVLGESTTRDDDIPEKGEQNGQVLAASTGQVLAATGQSIYLPVLLGAFLAFGALLTVLIARTKHSKS